MKSKKKYRKIFARVPEDTYLRLDEIRKKYNFKSNYQIVQYLMHSFLRVADPVNDQQIESVPEEIEDMFSDLSQAEKHFNYEKPKKGSAHISPDDL